MNNTDLQSIKSVSKAFCKLPVEINEKFSFVCHHPFTCNTVVMYDKMYNLADNTEFAEWSDKVCERIDKCNTVTDIFLMINKPYYLTFLKFTKDYLCEEDFCNLLSTAWIGEEFPSRDTNVSMKQLCNWFRNANKKFLMSEKDLEIYNNFDDTVTIYRGVQAGNYKGMSWTTDYKTAKWFANRFKGNGKVYKTEVSKSDILAYFSCRNENEIVIDVTTINKDKVKIVE